MVKSYILEHPFRSKQSVNTSTDTNTTTPVPAPIDSAVVADETNVTNKKVLVVYGTCSGNAEAVAEAIKDGLCDEGLEVDLKKSELIKASICTDYGLLVLVSSTWDVGKLNINYIGFDREFKELDLKDKYVAIVGLGDSKNYDVFCGAADIMEESVKKTNATQLMHTLRIDGEVYSKLKEYRSWGNELAREFLEKLGK